jgi:hypothetical protein
MSSSRITLARKVRQLGASSSGGGGNWEAIGTLIKHERRETPLPEMPTPSLTKVDHASVTTVGLSDSPSQIIGRLRTAIKWT